MRVYFKRDKDPISFTGETKRILFRILSKKFDQDLVEYLLDRYSLPDGWEQIKLFLKTFLEEESVDRLETLVLTGSEPEGWQEIFGRNVRTQRKALRLCQKALASALGCQLTWLSGTERGMTNPRIKDLQKLVDNLKVAPSELLGGPCVEYYESDIARNLAIKVRILHTQFGGKKSKAQSFAATVEQTEHLRLSTVNQIAKEFGLQLYEMFI